MRRGMVGVETVAAVLGIIGLLSSSTRALWKIAANDSAYKTQVGKTFEGIEKAVKAIQTTQADIHDMLLDHEVRISVVESKLDGGEDH